MKSLATFGSLGAKLAIVAVATVGGTALVGSSVFASLSATATNISGTQSISTATLKLVQVAAGNGLTAGFTTAVSGVAPGDTINRFIDLSNTGTMAGSAMNLKVADTNATVLTTDPSNGLQVLVKECPTAYAAVTGTCSAGETTAVAQTSANTLLGVQTVTLSTLAPSTTVHLKFIITLPTGSEVIANGVIPGTSVTGLTSLLTWTFNEAQRATNITTA